MSRNLHIPEAVHLADPGPGAAMSSASLGTHLAHMCWESLGGFLESEFAADLFDALGIEGDPGDRVGGELLVFHLWMHARALRDGFRSRDDDPCLRSALKAYHSAIYSDLVLHGTPKAELPILEERVSQRYIEYHRALEDSDEAVGLALARHLGLAGEEAEQWGRGIVTHLRRVTDPLLDFLLDLEIPTS